MLNILNFSPEELLNFIKEEQKVRISYNMEQVKTYITQINTISDEIEYNYENEVIFMIKHSASSKFISKYLNITEEYIKKIAVKHKCQSYLLSNLTENINARCFSKNQILRSCEDFNYICPMCFKPFDITNIKTLTGHHIQPFAKGGKTTKENCLPLHVSCHFYDFKLLHSSLFSSDDPIYSAKYFNLLKHKLQREESGMNFIVKSSTILNH